MASSRMVPFALVMKMRVLRFNDLNKVMIGGIVSLPPIATNERWLKYKGLERVSGLSC